jgi:hypothetical protein
MAGICINEDIAHFYANHPHEDMTPEGCDRLVDFYAQFSDVAALLFCINVQRALFNSRSWERVYDGYDPEAGPNQPVLQWLENGIDRELTLGSQGRYWIHNLWLLEQRGVDHVERWLARCQHCNIEGWLSMRMNDLHFNNILDAFWHSTFWRQRPDLWVVPHDPSGHGRAFDYSHAEVRQHHMKLIREVLECYDLYGLELDWIRTMPYFAPGAERQGRQILTDFIAEVRQLADAAAKRLGHPVKVGVRVPSRPESGRRLGLDGLTWAREGLVDQLVLSSLVWVIEFDMPIDEWKRQLGDAPVSLVAQFGTTSHSFPGAQERGADGSVQATPEYLRGAAAAAFHQGADRVYLFNHCYFESEFARRDRYCRILESIGSPAALAGKPRRHAITYPEITAPDESAGAVLPVTLSAGKTATLHTNTGPIPDMEWAAVVLGFDRQEKSPDPLDLEVRVNGAVSHYLAVVSPGEPPGDLPAMTEPRMSFIIPKGAVIVGRNTTEISCSRGEGTIVWCEIYIA